MSQTDLVLHVRIANIDMPALAVEFTIGMGGLSGVITLPPSPLFGHDEAIAGLANAPVAIFIHDALFTPYYNYPVLLATGIVTGIYQQSTPVGSVMNISFTDELAPLRRFNVIMGTNAVTLLGNTNITDKSDVTPPSVAFDIGSYADVIIKPIRGFIMWAFGENYLKLDKPKYSSIKRKYNWVTDFDTFAKRMRSLFEDEIPNPASFGKKWFGAYVNAHMLHSKIRGMPFDRISDMSARKTSKVLTKEKTLIELINNQFKQNLFTTLAELIGTMLKTTRTTFTKIPFPRLITKNGKIIGIKDIITVPDSLRIPIPICNYIKADFINGIEFGRSLSPYTHGAYISGLIDWINKPQMQTVSSGIQSDIAKSALITTGPNIYMLKDDVVLNLAASAATVPTTVSKVAKAIGKEIIEERYLSSGRAVANLFAGVILPGFPTLFEINYGGEHKIFFGRTMNIKYSWSAQGKFSQTLGISSIISADSDYLKHYGALIQVNKEGNIKAIVNQMNQLSILPAKASDVKTLKDNIDLVVHHNKNRSHAVLPESYKMITTKDYDIIFNEHIAKIWPVEIYRDFLKILGEYYASHYETV